MQTGESKRRRSIEMVDQGCHSFHSILSMIHGFNASTRPVRRFVRAVGVGFPHPHCRGAGAQITLSTAGLPISAGFLRALEESPSSLVAAFPTLS